MNEFSWVPFIAFAVFGFCCFLLLQFFYFSILLLVLLLPRGVILLLVLYSTLRSRGTRERSGPSVSGVEALRPPLQPLPALRCLKLLLQLHSQDVGSRSGAAETMFKAAPQRIRF